MIGDEAMRKRWKSITAMCLSAMIGCALPVGTMMAAEESEAAEHVQESETSEPVEEVLQDAEGLQTMRNIAHNMAWLLKCIEAGREQGIAPRTESGSWTNFIRG